MSPYVDRFVLGYSDYTFAGKKTNYSFHPYESEIKQYWSQIFMFFVDISDVVGVWKRENLFRDRLLLALPLIGETPNDILFVSDTDEVPLAETIEYVLKNYKPGMGPLHHQFDMMYYNFRWKVNDFWKKGYFIWSQDAKKISLNTERLANRPVQPNLMGIHMSYFFHDIASFQRKLLSFSHTEYSVPPFTETEEIFARTVCGQSIFNHERFGSFNPQNLYYHLVPNDPKFKVFMSDGCFSDVDRIDKSKLERKQYCPSVMESYQKCLSKVNNAKV